jgi:hypothetical protein
MVEGERSGDGDPAPGSAAPDRARAFLMQHLARFYDFRGLFRWKRRFDPSFEDRYLVYPAPLALPRVALSLIRAQSPAGLRSYLPWARSPQSAPEPAAEQAPDPAAERAHDQAAESAADSDVESGSGAQEPAHAEPA